MLKMNPIKIIKKYYSSKSKTYRLLMNHNKLVIKKALEIAKKAKHLNPNLQFIREAAMLHDIGIFRTNAPEIGCYGSKPYICHGYLGRKILEEEGFPKHALVCERHIGVGINLNEIKKRKLPLPKRDMVPISVEEQIVCLADKFFSKTGKYSKKERSLEEIREGLLRFGKDHVERFNLWLKRFHYQK